MMNMQCVIPLIQELREQQLTIATCESLTAGMVASLLARSAGASQYFRGGLVTYATDLKASLAGVSLETLAQYGPVSEKTAREMAEGCAKRCDAVLGLSLTGVAGPEPVGNHEVGEVWVGIYDARVQHSWAEHVFCETVLDSDDYRYHSDDDPLTKRDRIRYRASCSGLSILATYVRQEINKVQENN